MQHKLDALLVFPPFVSVVVDSVYPSVYFLANYLRQCGFRADWWDMNRASLPLVLERCVLDAEITRLSRARRAYEEYDGYLSPAEAADYHRTVAYEAWLSLTRRNRGVLLDDHNPRDLRTGPLTLGAMLTPLVERYFAFAESNKAIPVASELSEVLDSERAHRFSALVRETVYTRIRNDRPLIVGISIPFSTQLVTALLLAREIKSASPETHVCLGGPTVTLLSREFTDQCIAMQIVDSVVRHEGEKPIARLVSDLRDGRQPGRFPGPDGVTKGTSASLSRGYGARLAASHTRLAPLPMHLRGGGVPVPVLQSTGCYWGKCTFCDYVNLYCDSRYRYRPVHAVVDDMEYYATAGVSHFRLIAEAVPPRHAAEIAREILHRGLRVTWHSYLRVDRQFHVSTLTAMRESGYRYATVGLESSENRLLRILNKGYSADDVRRFFENCREAGFSFGQVNIIYDIPTSTYKEALGVFEFCKSYKDVAPKIQLFPFQLTSTSSMASDPDKYGILIGGLGTVQHGTFLTTAIPFADPRGMNDKEKANIRVLYQEHDAEVTDDHAYGGLMRTILRARHLQYLDSYTFRFLDEKCFHEAETRITAHDAGRTTRPRKLLYCRDSHEVFNISDDAMSLLKAVSGKELSVHDLVARIGTACSVVADERVALEFVKLCATARLIEWCAHQNGQRMYAVPEFLPEWRRLMDNSEP